VIGDCSCLRREGRGSHPTRLSVCLVPAHPAAHLACAALIAKCPELRSPIKHPEVQRMNKPAIATGQLVTASDWLHPLPRLRFFIGHAHPPQSRHELPPHHGRSMPASRCSAHTTARARLDESLTTDGAAAISPFRSPSRVSRSRYRPRRQPGTAEHHEQARDRTLGN
jgi:hypothetical protein